jgi:hypothetical protein
MSFRQAQAPRTANHKELVNLALRHYIGSFDCAAAISAFQIRANIVTGRL